MQAWTVPPVPRLRPAETRSQLQLFDTASQQLVDVEPREGTARMYVCGITPYDATHVGHANTYVVFDLLHRLWQDRGLYVSYVQNVTDVDDPLLERFGHNGPAVVDPEFVPNQLTMLVGSCWSDAIDHAVGEKAFLVEPVSQGGIP